MSEFHHGCCVGADATAALITSEEVLDVDIHAHPGDLVALTDADALRLSDVRHRPQANLVRNKAIVNACDVLVACPKGPEEIRSGTWSTVRYAVKQGKPVTIIWPDGKTEQR
jgi:hypothetical protein